ncbi:type I DNA topoisomerase [Deinococcus pimensis]|uniref:type I DNA topoisomerase n=1 Tax=Deinococcus pimensis TaxID=309888 RepID=UPI000481CFA2|nr:type I DNA topoisomerase [Deinococcus pimensis]
MTTLVIVESPSKAKKIQAYLGTGYTVRASLGHVRDLPASRHEIPARYAAEPWARLGIDVQAGFRPLYVVPRSKAKVVRELRELAAKATRVLLATDPDREGEAIAYHLAQALGLKGDVQRMTFHEITKDAIQTAAKRTRPLDYALVGAQESRRALDRLVGYGVSPVLWGAVAPGLSAGRVQSAALATLCERELERMRFVSAPYWRVTATVGEEPFTAVALSVNGRRLATPRDFDHAGNVTGEALVMTDEQAAKLVAYLKVRPCLVERVERAPFTTRPPAPFTTSTLQQEASRSLRLSPKQTMDVAQKLYEGGFITYMRTDSPALSDEATRAARDAAEQAYGPGSVPAAPRLYAAKVKNAQEAHEAVRPAGRTFRASADTGLAGTELALYDLILRRTVASQMTDLLGERTTVTLRVGAVVLQAVGRTVRDPGFTRAYQDTSETGPDDDAQALPDVREGESLPVRDAAAEHRRTPAPGRFTEASLVRALEKAGVGRPSTYASILSTIAERGYARVVKRQLVPTWLGLLVNVYLREHFERLVDVRFTAAMEEDLDRIASGELRREAYLTRFWTEGLAGVIAGAPRLSPTLAVPRVPGATVTVRSGEVVLALGSRTAPLSEAVVPDELTADVVEEVLSGRLPPGPNTTAPSRRGSGRGSSGTRRSARPHKGEARSGKRTARAGGRTR